MFTDCLRFTHKLHEFKFQFIVQSCTALPSMSFRGRKAPVGISWYDLKVFCAPKSIVNLQIVQWTDTILNILLLSRRLPRRPLLGLLAMTRLFGSWLRLSNKAINPNLTFYYSSTSWQNRSIWSATVCNAARQNSLSVKSISATFATSSAVAMGVV